MDDDLDFEHVVFHINEHDHVDFDHDKHVHQHLHDYQYLHKHQHHYEHQHLHVNFLDEHEHFNHYLNHHVNLNEHVDLNHIFNVNLDLLNNHNALGMKYDVAFWNETWKRPYGRYNRHHQAIWDAVRAHVRGKVADLGCGPCVLYRDTDIDLTGVDFSASALEEAKKNHPLGTYILADVRETGLAANTFDTVLMLGLLDYFENWESVLGEAERIAKPGGKLIATLFHGYEGHNWERYPRVVGNWRLWEKTKSSP